MGIPRASRFGQLALVLSLVATACGGGGEVHTVHSVVTLRPAAVASKVSIHYEVDNEIYCGFDTQGQGPRIAPVGDAPDSPIVVGWEFFADYGTQPFPCGRAVRHDYIAALYFDLSHVIRDGGVVERALLRFLRDDSEQPIDVPDSAEGAGTLYVLAPSSPWLGGYYVGDESDPDANPPASLLYSGTPRTMVHFRNSADPVDAAQTLDVTTLVESAMLSRGESYHGILLSPRSDPSARAHYLAGDDVLYVRPTHGSCTGVFGGFELEVSVVRLERR